MTDFYSVLRTALDRVGAASNDQRDRVYDHVREVMVRKLRNHRPPVGEAEIASRIVTFEAAVERIETEIAEEAEAEMLARGRARRPERRQEPAYEPPAYDEIDDDEAYGEEPLADGGSYRDPEPRRYADPDIDEEEGEQAAPSSYDDDAQAPEPMWGVPAIDMAWDETREQWRDVRRPPDPFVEENPGWDRDNQRDDGDYDRGPPERRNRGFLGRRSSRQGAAAAAPSSFAEQPEDEDELQVEHARAGRPSRGGWTKRLLPARSRSARRPAENESDGVPGKSPRRGRKARRADAAEPRRGRRGRANKRAEQRRREEAEANDPIAELASKLAASRNGYERSEPLLLQPPTSGGNGLYLPSPEHFDADEDEEAFEERPRRHGRSRREKRRNRRPSPRQARSQALDFEEEGFDEEPEEALRGRQRSRRAKRPSRRELRRARSEAAGFDVRPRRNRVLIGAIFVVAAGIMAWAAYVFLPALFPSDADGTSATPVVATPATAEPATTPVTEAIATGDGIVMFAGDDPSVFESGADNPINYQTDDGGFVRITSSINTGGAKLIIDPAIASSLAGHQIRVVIEARGSPDQAAAAVRLAYQQDLLILDWRLARLIGEFAVITATWTLPDRATAGTDYMLIEPGVAGDGTAIDVRNIRFEVLD